ncbi:MAG: hypothetical protein HFI82_02810 [Eubacterium sp.]|jgi:hypothetical protein|nr:hypothetical protein [Eubacterium sp.]
MNNIINFLIYTSLTGAGIVLSIFILFLLFYAVILKYNRNKKEKTFHYVKQNAIDWSTNNLKIIDYDIKDLHSPIKMYNSGIGNKGYNMSVQNYSNSSLWFIKM